jgi:hypothetical protein
MRENYQEGFPDWEVFLSARINQELIRVGH